MPALTHPSDDSLHEFLLGKCADAEERELEAHLAQCESCLARAARAVPSDTLVSLLTAVAPKVDAQRSKASTAIGEATPADFAATDVWGESPTPASGSDAGPPDWLTNHPRYRLIRPLGSGGMGSVWLAEHTVMGRPVALKVIRPEFLAREGAVERFRREVRAAARLNHPNIAAAHDAEEADGSHFLVMEYVPGETLAEVVRRGPLPVADACRAVRDAARGLAHAHATGLIHRDLKPGNLIRTPDGTVKVLDFGLVVPTEPGEHGLTGESMVVGTPDYIAPEQAEDPRSADARSDVYSLGCTLYHLLAGQVPFPVNSTLKKLDAHRMHLPDVLPGVPRELFSVLSTMVAKSPVDRFQTAGAVAEALEPYCTAPVVHPGATVSRSHVGWIMAAALALAVCAAVIYKIQRDNEVITIETKDPDVEVTMRRNGKLVRIVDAKTNDEWKLDTENMRLRPDGSELTVDLRGKEPIFLRRGKDGKILVTIRRQTVESPPETLPPLRLGESRIFRGHNEGLLALDVSPDGRLAVTAGNWPDHKDATIRLWDLETGREIRQLQGHSHHIASLAFSPDGKRLLSGSHDWTARLWDTESGRELKKLSLPGFAFGVVFTPDGKQAITTTEKPRLWDLETGADLNRFANLRTHYMRAVAISPDGKTIATGDWPGGTLGIVSLWEVETGKRITQLQGHRQQIYGVCFSPNGELLASASEDYTVRVWDIKSGAEKQQVMHARGVMDVAFSPGGKYLLTGGADQILRLCEAETGKEVERYAGHENRIWNVAFTPNGKHALSASEDRTLRMWRLPEQFVDPRVVAIGTDGDSR